MDHYAENAELRSAENPQPFQGKNAIRESVRAWMTAFPDIAGDIEMSCHSGGHVAMLVHFSGTHRGTLELGGESLAPTNKKVDIPVAMLLTLDQNGKIAKEQDVFNVMEIVRQISVAPETAARILATPARH